MNQHPVRPSVEPTWGELDRKTVSVTRALIADIVERCGGHPGTAISLAPAAYLLFSKIMRHNPLDPSWVGRDRFVLSLGHSSLTLYIQLFLAGYPIALEDLMTTRSLGSKAHGHPEYDVPRGVEMTTGPLGEGMAASIGMAMASRRVRGLLDPNAAPGESVFDHTIWVFASDGDIQEGVVAEASSLAGYQKLGNLVVLWDDNKISAEGCTSVSTDEDTLAKFEASGWHTQRVEWVTENGYVEDVDALESALHAAKAETGRPSIIALRTLIAWPSPTIQNTAGAHAGKLGPQEIRDLKMAVGLEPDQHFALPEDVVAHAGKTADRGRMLHAEWSDRFARWSEQNPERRALFDRLASRTLPSGWESHLPSFEAGGMLSTRVASGQVLNGLKDVLPELWGGAADMNESTSANMKGESSFLPQAMSSPDFGPGGPYGRTLHFGVREHAMAAALNGIALNGLTRAYGATFLQFAFHMMPSIRLGALMGLPTIFIFTHDSIGLGEDGPTHQPIEHLAALRAMPGLDVVRPADANEVASAWQVALGKTQGATCFALSRQAVPVLMRGDLPGGQADIAPASLTARGGYVLADPAVGKPIDVIVIATGSEVQLALATRERLAAEGVGVRVVSMPCREWFTQQSVEYRDSVLPPDVRARVSVEAATVFGWRDFVGDAGRSIGIDRFGESAPASVLFEHFGFTTEAVVAAARETIEIARRAHRVPSPTR